MVSERWSLDLGRDHVRNDAVGSEDDPRRAGHVFI